MAVADLGPNLSTTICPLILPKDRFPALKSKDTPEYSYCKYVPIFL